MQEPSENQESRTSKINGAYLELLRIDKILQKCHEYREKGNLSKWNEQLDGIWAELASEFDLTKVTKNQRYFVYMKKINNLIGRNQRNRMKLNQILIMKQIFLKNLQNKQGKGTAYIDEDEDAIE